MREYDVTTNTDLTIAVPTLTITVRAALFVPKGCLPIEDAGETRGRETWVSGHPVLATFQMSKKPVGEGPLSLEPVLGLDGKEIAAKKASVGEGVAYTGVRYSLARGRDDEGNPTGRHVPESHDTKEKSVGLAKIPLFGKKKGSYVLKIVPPAAETTTPDGPAGPDTKVRGFERAYRPLHVLVTLDDELYVTEAVTCTLRDGEVHLTDVYAAPDEDAAKTLELPVNHGYVTAFSPDEVAIDLKPDVLKSEALDKRNRNHDIDMVVLHATGGPLMGNAVNTGLPMRKRMQPRRDATGAFVYETVNGRRRKVMDAVLDASGNPIYDEPLCPHYEIDLDGHVAKFVEDENWVFHSGDSYFYFHEEGTYDDNVGPRSIGIELTHMPDTPYPDRLIVGLLGLLSRLKSKYGVKPHRFVGHVDTLVTEGSRVMDANRIRCPSRDLDWPRLERAGFGRKSDPRTLGPSDYSGFFSLTRDELRVAQKQKKPLPPALRLGDKDATEIWGGVDWKKEPAKGVLAARSTPFEGIVKELQTDLKIIGYSVNEDGDFSHRTDRAVAHFVAHTFSGTRRNAYQDELPGLAQAGLDILGFNVPAEEMFDFGWHIQEVPTRLGGAVPVTGIIAAYIKGTADAIRGS